ncbi:ABC transporter ATP-binding protein [Variovorax sp. OV329]|uniref:ABC transporter ATP-binding protein n=1 Tax=Variovorax sp. OV329 TaxID=1882825 RepID=UPI0008E734D6|nr:ABC transporter ATP-binding protein [Variovorax sp. OV329]SFM93804.1 putative spermidine/putrescine transport system ATP-binding protein [Variovorax sp. OV329]
MDTYINFQAVEKRYGSFQAVSSFDLIIAKGEMVALLGPSGCGKTTTLRMLAGFVPVTSGRVHVGGRDVTQVPPYRRNIGMVFQGYALFPHMTVEKNVAFGLEMRGLAADEIGRRVKESLARVRLERFADRLPKQLSGGQQQRVALARAMAINPDVLLLDEPLSALDARLRHEVRAEIRQLQRELGLTTLLVTHDQDEALSMADRLVVMNKGCVEQVGTPSQLYERPANRFVAEFMGKSNFLDGSIEGPGMFRVQGGPLLACAERSAGPASCLSFRPERTHVAAAGQARGDGHNALEGTVALFTYLGPVIECQVRVDGGQVISALLPNSAQTATQGLELGSRVQVSWNASDSRLLA